MKKKLLFVSLAVAGIIGYSDFNNNPAHTSSSGPPEGHSGGGAESGATCTSCHAGGATNAAFSLNVTSDVPSSGYVPGSNYTISITAASSSTTLTKAGFQASVQANSAHTGSLIASGNGTQIAGSNFVEHSSTGNSVTGNTKTWTFQWTAPSTNAPNSVTVFVAGNFTNNNSANTGDVIKTATLNFAKASATGLEETTANSFSVFPNPANGTIFVNSTTLELNQVSVLDLNGKEVKSVELILGKAEISTNELNSGVYFVKLGQTIKKVIIN